MSHVFAQLCFVSSDWFIIILYQATGLLRYAVLQRASAVDTVDLAKRLGLRKYPLTEIQYPPKYPIWVIKKIPFEIPFFLNARSGTNLRKSGKNNGQNAVGGI